MVLILQITTWHKSILDERHQNVIVLFDYSRGDIFATDRSLGVPNDWYWICGIKAYWLLPTNWTETRCLGKLMPAFRIVSDITQGPFWHTELSSRKKTSVSNLIRGETQAPIQELKW